MDKYKIIVNPTAGRGRGEQVIPQVERMLSEYNFDFDLVRTERPWHAAELAQEAATAGYDVVVAVGGDGTANEVLNGLMQAKTSPPSSPPLAGGIRGGAAPLAGGIRGGGAMGILCVGRGNDFAYGMGIPADLEEGCRALAQDYRRTVDVGRVVGGLYPEGRYFGNGVGIGFDRLRRRRRFRGGQNDLADRLPVLHRRRAQDRLPVL